MTIGGDGIPVADEHLVGVGLHEGVGEAVALVAEADAAGEHRGAVEGLHVHAVEAGREPLNLLTHCSLRAGGVLYLVAAVADGRALYVADGPARGAGVHRGVGYGSGLVLGAHAFEGLLQRGDGGDGQPAFSARGSGACGFRLIHQGDLLRCRGPLPACGVLFTLLQHQRAALVHGQEPSLLGVSHLRSGVDAAQQYGAVFLYGGPFVVRRAGAVESAADDAQIASVVVAHLQSEVGVAAEFGGVAFVLHFDGHAVVVHEGAAVGDACHAVTEELACGGIVEIPGVARGGQCGKGRQRHHREDERRAQKRCNSFHGSVFGVINLCFSFRFDHKYTKFLELNDNLREIYSTQTRKLQIKITMQ